MGATFSEIDFIPWLAIGLALASLGVSALTWRSIKRRERAEQYAAEVCRGFYSMDGVIRHEQAEAS